MKLSEVSRVAKLFWLDTPSIILDSAVASAKVDGDVDFGCSSIERVFEQADGYVVKRGDDDGGLELVDNVLRELPYGHGRTGMLAWTMSTVEVVVLQES